MKVKPITITLEPSEIAHLSLVFDLFRQICAKADISIPSNITDSILSVLDKMLDQVTLQVLETAIENEEKH